MSCRKVGPKEKGQSNAEINENCKKQKAESYLFRNHGYTHSLGLKKKTYLGKQGRMVTLAKQYVQNTLCVQLLGKLYF